MEIKISTRHGHLDSETQEFIRDKASKLLHFWERITSIGVTIDLDGDLKRVEFNVNAEHKHDFVAAEANGDIRAAVDLVLDKIERQLRKYKEKVQDHRRTTPMSGE